MQNDLISRSALLESLIHCDGLGRKSLEAVIKHIKEQPTAYDVEKVVNQIEKERRWRSSDSKRTLGYAIDIVRNGGKE